MKKGKAPSRRALATVAALACLAHAGALGAGFVFDDRGAIQENPVVKGPLDLGALLSTDFWGRSPGDGPGTWRPLVVLSFWLNEHVLHGGFHQTNLLLHAATAVALALALFRQTQRATFALACAATFGVLGIHTEAVVGLVGRADVMAAGLSFLAWYLLGRPDEPAPERRAARASLAFAGAIACKESAVVFPLVVFFADRLLARSRPDKPFEPLRHAPLALTAVVMIGMRSLSFASPLLLQRDVQGNPLLAEGLGPRLFTSLALFGMALRRIVAPVGLSADYSFAAILPEQSPLALGVLAGGAALVGVFFVAIRFRKDEPLLSLAAVALLVPWLAVSQVPFLLPTIFAERLLYLPALGFAIAVAWFVERVFEGQRRDPSRVRRAALVLGPVLALNVALAWQRSKVWRDDRSLFEAAIEVVPRSARAHHNYGSALLNENKSSLAIPYFERASEILPTWSEPHAQLGVALLDMGRPREAEPHFRKAVELEPDSAKAVFNLAVFLAREGRLVEAKAVLGPFVQKYPSRVREASLLRQLELDTTAEPPR